MSTKENYIVPDEFEGIRLDKVLEQLEPETGLRYRRRLCDDGRVRVDGRNRKPGYKLRAGQEVAIIQKEGDMSAQSMGLRVVEQGEQFAAVYKPGGVHSAAIAGKDSASVEAVLGELFPSENPILLNRLDCLTSGILLVAMNAAGEKAYHELEDSGSIKKFYVAQVHGRLDGLVTIKSGLDTDDRKTTRVLSENDADARRWTDVEVMAHDRDADTTDVRCLITKGARHQIRAHLASIGHPIIGDPLYGEAGEGEVLRLHHQAIEFAGFQAHVTPSWED